MTSSYEVGCKYVTYIHTCQKYTLLFFFVCGCACVCVCVCVYVHKVKTILLGISGGKGLLDIKVFQTSEYYA